MKDITHSIEKAINQDILWKKDFISVVEELRGNGYIVSFWENEESWAAILLDDSIVGYLWGKYPLAFIKTQYVDSIKGLLTEEYSIVFIDVNDISEKAFVVNYEMLKDYVDYGLSQDGFSAEDFWFVTNA